MGSSDDSKIISASEIGEYIYCSRSFWLRRMSPNYRELTPKRTFLDLFRAKEGRLELGAKLHVKHSLQIKRQQQTKKIAYLLVLFISIFLIICIIGFLIWRILLLSLSF